MTHGEARREEPRPPAIHNIAPQINMSDVTEQISLMSFAGSLNPCCIRFQPDKLGTAHRRSARIGPGVASQEYARKSREAASLPYSRPRIGSASRMTAN